jgi:peptidoglycan-associated lipoprotein
MRSTSWIAIGAAALLAGACASQPKPEPVVPEAPAPAARPAPVAAAPAPAPVAAPAGPRAGSRADFLQFLANSQSESRVYFEYDSYTLDESDRAALQAQANWLKQFPGTRLQIEGNADERGTREYNIALGYRRAEAVSTYLNSLGVDQARISTISYGKDRPIDPGRTEGSYSRNRNANTNLTTDAAS